MCGIIGAVSDRNIVPVLIDGLKRLEYRGYDSAGLAVLNGSLQRARARGRVAQLETLALGQGMAGETGIAHTRWATHGEPSERNAHPHLSGGVSVVHNGIIENHESIRRDLEGRGYTFASDTDSEAIAHLIHSHLADGGDLLAAVRQTTTELEGAYAIAVIEESEPGRLVVARSGAPLLLGLGEHENLAASDALALAPVTQRVIDLQDGDCASLTSASIRILDAGGRSVTRPVRLSEQSAAAGELGAYRHFMQKEIFEQPAAVERTLGAVTAAGVGSARMFGDDAERTLRATRHVLLLACGTSYHAGMVARYWLERIAGITAQVEIASEYRYREPARQPHTLVVTISQSGETADTIAALAHAKSIGHRNCLAVCNVPGSTLVRESNLAFPTHAGPEIGVASTKAFTTQLVALALLTASLARFGGRLSREAEGAFVDALFRLPAALADVLLVEPEVADLARELTVHSNALFLGRGVHYPIAMEGALKLKEISYIHAEAYAGGELKHGPLALVDEEMPVIALAPADALLEKLKSNLHEVRARGGRLYVFADADAGIEPAEGLRVIRLPEYAGLLSPIVHTLPLQLLAYHAALVRGNDVDKPRNLAKSVTVE